MNLAKPMDTLKKHDDNRLHKGKDKEHDSTIISKTTQCYEHNNLNLEGAYLHVLGDMLQSVGVIIGGAAIW